MTEYLKFQGEKLKYTFLSVELGPQESGEVPKVGVRCVWNRRGLRGGPGLHLQHFLQGVSECQHWETLHWLPFVDGRRGLMP